jgi:hypothetical protein
LTPSPMPVRLDRPNTPLPIWVFLAYGTLSINRVRKYRSQRRHLRTHMIVWRTIGGELRPECPLDSVSSQRRLITLYQTLHDAIHAKSGQEGPLKLQYIRTEKESVMGWVCYQFEAVDLAQHQCRLLSRSSYTSHCHHACQRQRLLELQMLLRGG